MAPPPELSRDPLRVITTFSRRVADTEDPAHLPRLLADAVSEMLGVPLVVVLVTTENGAEVAATRGVPGHVHLADGQDAEAAEAALAALPGVGRVSSHHLASGGGLYGTLILGWHADDLPPPELDRVAEALVDIAATSFDRAFRTSELRRTIRELVDSREELARTASLRSLGQMAAIVAHEVKNPLTSIGGVLQVLRTRFATGTQEHQVVGRVLGRLQELDRMVDELLVFARPRPPHRTLLPVRSLLEEVAAAFRQDPAHGDVRIEVEADGSEVAVDPGMFQRVLHNLLINASHAMDGRGTVVLAGQADGDAVALSVTDEGPGVPEELAAQIFDPFFTTKARGSGLGLAITRQVAEAHGGSVRVERGHRSGARFVVTLPGRG